MKYFGTDGIRGIFNEELKELAFKAGYACGMSGKQILLARDTRESGDILARIFIQGAIFAGASVKYAGVLPTPALSVAVKNGEYLGVMITASHNPVEYNGLKIFSSDGKKLREINALEELMDKCSEHYTIGSLPSITEIPLADYISSFNLNGTISSGLKIVVDLANGAMKGVAPRILGQLARCTFLNTNGVINDNCGVFCPTQTQELVKEGYNIGFIFDGDGDRLLVVNEKGELLDGDAILYILSLSYLKRGLLSPRKVVCTEISNGGLKKSLSLSKIDCYKSKVGDDNVAKLMERKGAILGGEPSGHILINGNCADGLRTAVELCKIMIEDQKPISDLSKGLIYYPSIHKSVPYSENAFKECEQVAEKWRTYLGDKGNLVIRKSGTEPLLRMSVEATSESLAKEIMKELISTYKKNR